VDEDPRKHRGDPRAPRLVRRGGKWRLRLYSNSLSLAFLALFLLSFAGHALGGAKALNDDLRHHGKADRQVTAFGYMGTSRFWYESFQNWQSEFLAILAMVYLGVFLRQRGSPESKPVHTPHWENEPPEAEEAEPAEPAVTAGK